MKTSSRRISFGIAEALACLAILLTGVVPDWVDLAHEANTPSTEMIVAR